MNILELVLYVGGRIVCRRFRQRHYNKNKDEINRARREERACNGNINVNVV